MPNKNNEEKIEMLKKEFAKKLGLSPDRKTAIGKMLASRKYNGLIWSGKYVFVDVVNDIVEVTIEPIEYTISQVSELQKELTTASNAIDQWKIDGLYDHDRVSTNDE